MQDMSLNKLHDFIQVAYRMRKIYTNNSYFPKHILFTTIYLLQEHNLNPRNYSEQEIILIIFLQATGYKVYMYAKFGCSAIYRFLQLNTSRSDLLNFSTRECYSKQDLVKPMANIY
jgi:hypothetical protein